MILSREKRYLSAVFLFFASGAIQADVPYVFQDGDTIRADEIYENFMLLSSEVVTRMRLRLAQVQSVPGELHIQSEKFERGRDRLSVLGNRYDIAQIETLSFKDHSLFTLIPHCKLSRRPL